MATVLNTQKNLSDDYSCAICLDTVGEDENRVWSGHPAGDTTHSFHYECIERSFQEKAECPVCRAPAELINPTRVTALDVDTDTETVKKVAGWAIAAFIAIFLLLLIL